jgi:hypothetical protein
MIRSSICGVSKKLNGTKEIGQSLFDWTTGLFKLLKLGSHTLNSTFKPIHSVDSLYTCSYLIIDLPHILLMCYGCQLLSLLHLTCSPLHRVHIIYACKPLLVLWKDHIFNKPVPKGIATNSLYLTFFLSYHLFCTLSLTTICVKPIVRSTVNDVSSFLWQFLKNVKLRTGTVTLIFHVQTVTYLEQTLLYLGYSIIPVVDLKAFK